MRLKSIHVEGFKSYATATHIGEFDPAFNAITGLNGSGKSNILDAICFAMGITTLNSVRVSNLNELIYKQGTAGITKATVTLVFENNDKALSPTGYENEPEISVTRQIHVSQPCKYMINGRKSLAAEVSNMFRSVQLNVNNPHFLIMQGRITKVLNMKPEEIRDMLQEALGTLMFEAKKQEAQKKMAQKEVKVQAIKETLENQITPRVEKLREDKKDYDRFNAVVQDLQRHRRFLIAYEFHSKQETSVDGRKELEDIADKTESTKTAKKTATSDEKNFARELEERNKKRDQEANRPFKLAEEAEKVCSQQLVRASASKDAALEDLKQEQAGIKQKQARVSEVDKLSNKASSDLQQAKADVESAQQLVAKNRTLHERAKQGVDSAETGCSDKLQEELMDLQKKEQERSTQVKMYDMTVKTKTDAKKKLEKELASAKKEDDKNAQATERVDKLRNDLEAAKTKREALVGGAMFEETESTLDLTNKVKQLRTATSSALNFKYDSAALAKEDKCYGRVAGLVRLDADKVQTHALAMQVVAGSKMYHVVVDRKETGKKLLTAGKLQHRVTLVPLDTLSSTILDKATVEQAKKRAKAMDGWACLALDVIDKSRVTPEVWPVMQYVFGQTVLCDRMETAKALTFGQDKLKVRCVTLEGDVFDPSGTITGGARNSDTDSGKLLQDLDQVLVLENKVQLRQQQDKREAESKAIDREMAKLQHELEMALGSAAESKSFRLGERVKDVETELAQLEKDKVEALAEIKMVSAKAGEIKDLLKNAQTLKQKLITEAKQAEKQAKKSLKESEDGLQAATKRVVELESAIQQFSIELVDLSQSLKAKEKAMDQMETQMAALEQAFVNASKEYQQSRQMREEKERQLSQWDSSNQALEAKVAQAAAKAREYDMELKKMEARQQKLKMDVKAAEETMHALKKEHLWIEKEQQFFGKAHTEYDFELKNPAEISSKYKELEEVQAQLSRSINKKALAMMEKAEEEYDSLDRKRRTIEADRIAIERVISGLDKKKNEALVSAYEKVNKDFGAIFSMLLPGARAELRPVEGGTVLDGLEVKVAFGQTWKESLNELSGGQRSLLALSLVLALLRFKPAPLYILDEIDAALDLSHTQNIGVMLRTHFSNSQFIVVSLKEGMFANANCLFRTKFVDGVSTVTRTVNKVIQNAPLATLSENSSVANVGPSKAAGDGKSRKRTAGKTSEEHEEAAVGTEN